MELGYQMQAEAPRTAGFSRETQATLDRYRVGQGEIGWRVQTVRFWPPMLARALLHPGRRAIRRTKPWQLVLAQEPSPRSGGELLPPMAHRRPARRPQATWPLGGDVGDLGGEFGRLG